MYEITQKVCITGFPQLWKLWVTDTLAQRTRRVSQLKVTLLVWQKLSRQGGSYFKLTVGTLGLNTANSPYEFYDTV